MTTLTKRMAEDLTDNLAENGLRVRYLHSFIHSIERIEIIQVLQNGECDVLVGENLLRDEGLDLPIQQLEHMITIAANSLEFEAVANLHDKIKNLWQKLVGNA